MHFLKCSKCGHFNEVKSEYLIFCSGCNKKLDNNYTDWKRRNSEKSLDDFKQLICTTTTQELPIGNPKSKGKVVKGLIIGLAFIAAFGIYFTIGHFAGDFIKGFIKKPLLNKVMVEYANEINKACPIMIDEGTRFDNATILPDNVLQYNYTLINLDKASLNVDELKRFVEPRIINNVKTDPSMKIIRDNKTTVNYYYKDKTGVYLFTVSVTPDQYQ